MSFAVLDVLERLFVAAQHPDITAVRRYGSDTEPGGKSPTGVAVTYRAGSEGYLWLAAGDTEPCDMPAVLPELKFRAQHTLRLAVKLLDAGSPHDGVDGWRLVAFAGVALRPCGLQVRGESGPWLIRATSGSAPVPEPAEDPFGDWQPREGFPAGA